MNTATSTTEELVNREYRYGFVTDIETDTVPRGLNEDIIRSISKGVRCPMELSTYFRINARSA